MSRASLPVGVTQAGGRVTQLPRTVQGSDQQGYHVGEPFLGSSVGAAACPQAPGVPLRRKMPAEPAPGAVSGNACPAQFRQQARDNPAVHEENGYPRVVPQAIGPLPPGHAPPPLAAPPRWSRITHCPASHRSGAGPIGRMAYQPRRRGRGEVHRRAATARAGSSARLMPPPLYGQAGPWQNRRGWVMGLTPWNRGPQAAR